MREIVLRVPREDVEDVLDRLLPCLPAGLREVERQDSVELLLRGAGLPSLNQVLALAGRSGLRAQEREVPDDWRERRRADYVPDLIGGCLVVRPDWAAVADSPIEIVLAEGSAFGGGRHPTTRSCLDLLLGLPPAGSFADLGCGSGVLAILAARLGWAPVVAVDLSPRAVELTQDNARSNQVSIETRLLDLSLEAPPAVDGFAANVPPEIHARIARELADPLPRMGLLSGFHTGQADQVLSHYESRGFRSASRRDAHGWCVILLEQPLSGRVR
jgi:ribosomal protein L11 methyltransferase